ncbi:hypothetical protein KP509_17G018600 [Ceratopteris richardii]|uniref:SPARK domain-containing protein n=1 Tax=Ceratopteris richardii TaxID=49495 RepID=A0A8T2SW12_CERRI|nr:hypothetical protein KP509_17G018600 [Ceratopteris richardii]
MIARLFELTGILMTTTSSRNGKVLLLLICVIAAGEETPLKNGGVLGSSIKIERHKRYDNSIPASPVQQEAASCSLDLSRELLGGVRGACMQGNLDRRRCCPVLAAWLMAARAEVALHPPLAQEPGMPQLPDDSLVCIASLKAALAARGIFITPPPPPSSSSSCDVVICFCGIHLSLLTSQSCPLVFASSAIDSNATSLPPANSNTSDYLPALPRFVPHESMPSSHDHDFAISNYEFTNEAGKDMPLKPSENNTIPDLPPANHSTPSLASMNSSSPLNFLERLAANCTDHSYRGCTRCLQTLTQEMASGAAKGIIKGSRARARDCELTALMSLLELNKTLYIPTVSAVVRALLYNTENSNVTKCSLDTDNMPLALDYAELLSTSASINLVGRHRQSLGQTLLIFMIHTVLIFNFWSGFLNT